MGVHWKIKFESSGTKITMGGPVVRHLWKRRNRETRKKIKILKKILRVFTPRRVCVRACVASDYLSKGFKACLLRVFGSNIG